MPVKLTDKMTQAIDRARELKQSELSNPMMSEDKKQVLDAFLEQAEAYSRDIDSGPNDSQMEDITKKFDEEVNKFDLSFSERSEVNQSSASQALTSSALISVPKVNPTPTPTTIPTTTTIPIAGESVDGSASPDAKSGLSAGAKRRMEEYIQNDKRIKSSENIFQMLALEENASRADIKRAYKKVARSVHSDKIPNTDGVAFRKLTNEYSKFIEALDEEVDKKVRIINEGKNNWEKLDLQITALDERLYSDEQIEEQYKKIYKIVNESEKDEEEKEICLNKLTQAYDSLKEQRKAQRLKEMNFADTGFGSAPPTFMPTDSTGYEEQEPNPTDEAESEFFTTRNQPVPSEQATLTVKPVGGGAMQPVQKCTALSNGYSFINQSESDDKFLMGSLEKDGKQIGSLKKDQKTQILEGAIKIEVGKEEEAARAMLEAIEAAGVKPGTAVITIGNNASSKFVDAVKKVGNEKGFNNIIQAPKPNDASQNQSSVVNNADNPVKPSNNMH